MNPMIKYRGGKRRELSEILRFVPSEYDRYVEPFFGGGALYFHLEPQKAIINDLNSGLMKFYQGVKDNFSTLQQELLMLHDEYEANRKAFDALKATNPTEHVQDANEERYYQIRDMFNGLAYAEFLWATIYFYINKTAYSGMIRYNKNGEYNVPYGHYKHLSISGVTPSHHKLLKHTAIMAGDYQDVFDLCRSDDFVFLDPPYDCIFSDYGNPELNGAFSTLEHERLASAFFDLPCQALLIIGKTQLTDRLYGDHIVHEYEKFYAVNIRNRFKSESKHMLVTNRKRNS